MLYKSGINLLEGATDFVDHHGQITVFSAYIRTDQIKALNHSKRIKQIVVRWETGDLVLGVSDLDLYEYCRDNGITLFRNTRLHMKALWNYSSEVLLGSANLTNRGIGEKGRYNYELNGLISAISLPDQQYLNEVISSSQLVTQDLYDQLAKHVKTIEAKEPQIPEFDYTAMEDRFLISQLPMSYDIKSLYDIYSGRMASDLEMSCAAHDLAVYKVTSGLSLENFTEELRSNFNSHPFIVKFKEYVKSLPGNSLRYGGVVEWIRQHTTTVPTPRSWELKQEEVVNILYRWICELDQKFEVKVPGNRSEVIFYNP